MVFSSSHVLMWELDHKESWAPKNWCFWTVVLEKTLESSLDYKEIKPVHPKGNQPWIFIGRTDAEAEAPIFWLPEAKTWLIRKNADAGKDWRQEETGTTESEMVGWHHQLNGLEFEQAPGDGEGKGSLACCSPWGCKESDTTERLNNNSQALPILYSPCMTHCSPSALEGIWVTPIKSSSHYNNFHFTPITSWQGQECWIWNRAGPCVVPRWKTFCPLFLVDRTPASMTFPEVHSY